MELWLILAVPAGYLVLRRLLRGQARGRDPGGTISGKAYVTDGDGLRVKGHTIRIAGLDAPEHDQAAKHRDGYWFPHGKRVKRELIREIGGKHVSVSLDGVDKFGRLLGTVTCGGRDVGEWLVRQGHAIAAYSDRYKRTEQEARREKRGMWGHAYNYDPRDHRHRKRRKADPGAPAARSSFRPERRRRGAESAQSAISGRLPVPL